MTSRGQFNDEMTREEFDDEMTKDILNQQAGQDFDPLELVDVRVDHKSAFFDTMMARTYVGYGAPSLGFASTEQPGQHWRQSGTPNSILTNGFPLPGAMMNHMVIAIGMMSMSPRYLKQIRTMICSIQTHWSR